METTLHRQLKERYAGNDGATEVRLESYRIDAVLNAELIEIQLGSLGALRDKVRALLGEHRVRIVKPVTFRKHIVKLDRAGGAVISRRRSPKRGRFLSVFEDLVHFTTLFPHQRLTLELLLVEVEELRAPGHGRRRRRKANDYVVEDQRLLAVHGRQELRTADDLSSLVPTWPAAPFHTGQLAAALGVRRTVAQRIAYCLRRCGAIHRVGKAGNAHLYDRSCA